MAGPSAGTARPAATDAQEQRKHKDTQKDKHKRKHKDSKKDKQRSQKHSSSEKDTHRKDKARKDKHRVDADNSSAKASSMIATQAWLLLVKEQLLQLQRYHSQALSASRTTTSEWPGLSGRSFVTACCSF